MDDVIEIARNTLLAEAAAVAAVAASLDDSFARAVDLIMTASGKVVVTGLGKSGLVGSKIAATLASTGTVAAFVHSADALHGDAGMLAAGDVLVAISNSGSTTEVVRFANLARRRGCSVVGLTARPSSPLGVESDVVVCVDVGREADPLDLAPTSSTTAVMAVGDALAVALMSRRGFDRTDFAVNHPGGALGAGLLSAAGGPT